MTYVSVEHQKRIEPRYRTAMIVTCGILVSILLLLLLGRVVRPAQPMPDTESWQRPIYAGILLLALGVVFLRRVVLAGMVKRRAAAGDVEGVLRGLWMLSVLVAVLGELAAISGLVLYFLTGHYDYSLRLGGVGLILLLYAFPRGSEWRQYVTACAEGQK